jgi:TRAP-type uncharacterized transport system substrate-binding protein
MVADQPALRLHPKVNRVIVAAMKPLAKLQLSRLHLPRISLRDAVLTGWPLILLVLGAFWFAYQFVEPAPPSSFTFTTGAEDGAYHAYALRYQEILARNGVRLDLKPSAGSISNLERLADSESPVEAGFVQAGSGTPADYPGLVTLGSVYFEPVWIFYRGPAMEDQLRQLRGRRIAIGPQGSGTRRLATQLLLVNEAWGPPTRLFDHGGEAAAQALRRGQIDVALLIGPAESPTIRSLLNDKNIRLLSFDRANAYTKAFPFLSAVRLPEGGINLVRNIPDREVTLLAPTANVLVKEDLHPALASLLIQAMTEVHGKSGIFQKAGEFPALREQDFEASKEAERYYKSGPSFLQRYLPFWAAVLIDRIVVLLVPLIAVLIPAVRLAPVLYTWRIRSRIYRWYGELKILELELKQDMDAKGIANRLVRLEDLERRVYSRTLPIAFSADVYTLRQHIDMVRRSLVTPGSSGIPGASDVQSGSPAPAGTTG